MKAGWKTVKLDEVCEIVKGRKPTLRAAPAKGDLPYLVARYIRGLEAPEYGSPSDRGVVTLTEADTVIICDGSNSGEIFTGLNGIMSSTMGKVVKKTDIYDPYLRHFLSSTFELFNGTKTGAAIPHLDKDAFRKLEIPLPPLAEQKRIVALLDEAFAGIDEVKANAEAAQSAYTKIFESQVGLSFVGNADWKEATLSDLGETITGTTPPTVNPEYYGEYIPFVKPADFNEDGALVLDNHGLSKAGEKVARVTSPDSVLMVCIGATIGKSGYTTKRITTNQQINSFTPGSMVNFKFAYYQMISSSFQKQVFARANQATMPMISKSKWSEISLRFPNSYETQVKVAEQLSELKSITGKLSEIAERKVTALIEIRSSILAQAFAGELIA